MYALVGVDKGLNSATQLVGVWNYSEEVKPIATGRRWWIGHILVGLELGKRKKPILSWEHRAGVYSALEIYASFIRL